MTLNSEGLEKAAGRKWTKWSERRPPNASGTFRFRCRCEVLGLLLTPEWTEKMTLCGMGYGEDEWWPLSSCYWDGYRRYITHAGLEWSEVHADDPDDVVWGGLDLLQCPFTWEAAKIKAHGRYIGAPIWHTEAMSVGSSAVPFRRFTDAKKLVEFWNRRALPPVDGLEDERDEAIRRGEDQWAGWVKEEVARKAAEARISSLEKENKRLIALIEEKGSASLIHAARQTLEQTNG